MSLASMAGPSVRIQPPPVGSQPRAPCAAGKDTTLSAWTVRARWDRSLGEKEGPGAPTRLSPSFGRTALQFVGERLQIAVASLWPEEDPAGPSGLPCQFSSRHCIDRRTIAAGHVDQ
jgi:hypothetical protein